MKHMQINLENFGGHDVAFPISELEITARVQGACSLRVADPEKFDHDLKESGRIVQNNVACFYSEEFCEGPKWDELREAIVDMACKLKAINVGEEIDLKD